VTNLLDITTYLVKLRCKMRNIGSSFGRTEYASSKSRH